MQLHTHYKKIKFNEAQSSSFLNLLIIPAPPFEYHLISNYSKEIAYTTMSLKHHHLVSGLPLLTQFFFNF